MASKARKKTSLANLGRERWKQEDHSHIALELSQGSDRAAAIIGCLITEDGLTDALNSHFQQMTKKEQDALFYSVTAPLQTFSAKIMIGHAIGVYGTKFKTQLDTVRDIRNFFAHSRRPIGFDHPAIKRELDRLREIGLEVFFPTHWRVIPPSRTRYIANCLDLTVALERYARSRVSGKIIVGFPDWPADASPPLLHKCI